jgi:hypothetical protein
MTRAACCGAFLFASLIGLTNCSSGNSQRSFINNDVPPVVSATSGTPQSHTINGAFGQPMVATVTTNGTPAAGVIVTFTVPATGPSGTFAGGINTATSDANGVATSPAFTANAVVGAYTVTAAISGSAAPASFSLTNTTGAPATIAATSGASQGVMVNTSFAAPMVVTVVDGGQNPVSGAIVVFTAPATGASGTFADTASTTSTAATNASGVATSAAFTANGTAGADTVIATVAGVATPANFNLTNMAGPPATITATGGTPQSSAVNTSFPSPLSATVFDSGSNPASGVAVTFTAPASGASGTFANGTATETDTTDANGIATSTTFLANGTTGGPYTVTATAAAVSAAADFSLTNRVPSTTYVFYLNGQEAFGPDFYALAGAIEVDTSGNVLAGEQDYNDALGFTSPQPSGDTITGGTLMVSTTTGRGTLTLNTDNTSLGVGGVETFGLQFVNSNHALIMQFDGTATSSGSMDLQTLPSTLSGGYAFALSGVDYAYTGSVAFGGVFTITGGTTLENGTVDTNDAGAVSTSALSGTLSTFDSFGRGTIASTLNYYDTPIAFNYYVVGPEVLRIIDVDPNDSAIGSAFGQGANATTSSNASLGNSVFEIAGSPYPINYGVAGMFNTSSSLATFSGIADDNEVTYGFQLPASPISGNYSIASNGYGNMTIAAGDLGDVSALGIYMTDPNLNLNDPNNTATGLGGALIADLDAALPGGVGILIPQTDTATTSFVGKYALGAQGYNDFCCEFDFVGVAQVLNDGELKGTGVVGDPFYTFGASATNSNVGFDGTPLPDTDNIGRYTLFDTNPTPNPLNLLIGGLLTPFDVVVYQASGGQLFWLNEDPLSVFVGSLQQQGSLTGLPAPGATGKRAAKARGSSH